MNKVTRTLGKKVGFGRFGLPIWAVGAAVAIVGAAAGQAVGPVLTGSTTGTINLTVEQAITLDTDLALGDNPTTSGADDAVTTRNDEGTGFTVAMELHQGQTVTVNLFLQNDSGADGSAVMELNIPAGVDVEAEEISDGAVGTSTIISEAQLTKGTWLLKVASTAGAANDDGIQLTIEPKDDLVPGFYTIGGRIHQTAG